MKDTDIFIFGDSITYGEGDNEKCGWVNRLRLNLETNTQRDFYVYNLGISGDISEGIRKRFDFEIQTRKDEENETIIIFAIGINDTQDINGKDRVTIEKFAENILYLIKQAKKYSNKILFIGLSKVDETKVVPVPWSQEKRYFNRKIIQFDNKLKEICQQNEIRYFYMYDKLTLDKLADGLHPNSNGHQIICDKIIEEIKILDKEK